MMKSLILGFMLFSASPAKSQLTNYSADNNLLALSTQSKINPYVSSFIGNQALLVKSVKPFWGIYAERLYMMNEISSMLLYGGASISNLNGSFMVLYSGTRYFNVQMLSAGFSKKVNTKCSLGTRFNFLKTSAMGYSADCFLSADAGLVAEPNENFSVGFNLSNLVSVKIKGIDETERNSRFGFKWGIGYDMTKQFYFGLDFSKTRYAPMNIQAMIQYETAPHSLIRYGFSPTKYCHALSFSFLYKKIQITVLSTYNLKLGLSSGIMFNDKPDYQR